MAFFNSTKTVVIMCMVIVLLLGILVWANWDKISGDDKKPVNGGTPSGEKTAPNNDNETTE